VPPGRLGVRIFALVANGLADSKEKEIYRNIFTLTRIWRVTIQNLLIAALQNLRKLLSAVKRKPKRANCMEFLCMFGDFGELIGFGGCFNKYFSDNFRSQQLSNE